MVQDKKKLPAGEIDCSPTPQGLTDMLLEIVLYSNKPRDRAWARQELTKAMRVAYAYWYPGAEEYKVPGMTVDPKQKQESKQNQEPKPGPDHSKEVPRT